MHVNRLIRWGIPVAFLLAVGFASQRAEASPLLGQAGLVKAVSPAMAGWHHRYGGWGYRGCGGFCYGRPALYFGGGYRSFYRASYYAPRYTYAYAAPVYTAPVYSNYVYTSPYTTGVYGGYGGVAAYRPIVYSNPVYSTSFYAAQPAAYYPASYYTGGFGGYGGYGYSAYSYPAYSSYGYATYSPYGLGVGFW